MDDCREAFFEKSACEVEMKRSKKRKRGDFQLFFFFHPSIHGVHARKKLVSKLLVH